MRSLSSILYYTCRPSLSATGYAPSWCHVRLRKPAHGAVVRGGPLDPRCGRRHLRPVIGDVTQLFGVGDVAFEVAAVHADIGIDRGKVHPWRGADANRVPRRGGRTA